VQISGTTTVETQKTSPGNFNTNPHQQPDLKTIELLQHSGGGGIGGIGGEQEFGKNKTRCFAGGLQPQLGGTLDGFISMGMSNEQMSTCPSSITFKGAPNNNQRVKSNSP
jgi:hypothetical protein